MAFSSSVLMLAVVELCTDAKFPMCEFVDVFPIVTKASLALVTTSRERIFSYLICATCEVCFWYLVTKPFSSALRLVEPLAFTVFMRRVGSM